MTNTDTDLAQLEAYNAEVIKQRKALQRTIDERNALAAQLQREGVSFGQLASTMGMTRSAVQGMLRVAPAEMPPACTVPDCEDSSPMHSYRHPGQKWTTGRLVAGRGQISVG